MGQKGADFKALQQHPLWKTHQFRAALGPGKGLFCEVQAEPNSNYQLVYLLVSASLNQSTNSIFLSQQTSTSQSKPAQKPTIEQTVYIKKLFSEKKII